MNGAMGCLFVFHRYYLNEAIMEEQPESRRNRNKSLFNFVLNYTPNYAFHPGATASIIILPKLCPCGVREVAQTESE